MGFIGSGLINGLIGFIGSGLINGLMGLMMDYCVLSIILIYS